MLNVPSLDNYMQGCPLRAATCNTCYCRVCLIFPWCYWWNCLFLMEFTQKVTSLLQVWRTRLQVTQNLMTALCMYWRNMSTHRGPVQAACLFVCLKSKEMCGNSEGLNIINLNRVLSMLKLKPTSWQIWAIWWVLFWLLLHLMRGKQGWKAHFQPLQHQANFHPEIRIAHLPNRTTDKLKGWRFFLWHSIEDPFKIQALTAK